MASSTTKLRHPADSMDAIWAEWRIDDASVPSAHVIGAAPSEYVTATANARGSRLAIQRDQEDRIDAGLIDALNLEGPASESLAFSTMPRPASVSRPEDVPSTQMRETGVVSQGARRRPPAFPRIGDELAGFVILLELGRGAFARVYLAEEISLGRRQVAIKVSQPDGEEPRILARLQHAHIVPVHSVCDDPTSGLRVLCMPYFGGADLARVLQAAEGAVPTRHEGRSLVRALDQASRDVPEPASTRIHPHSGQQRSRVALIESIAVERETPAAASVFSDQRLNSASGLRGFFSRLAVPRADATFSDGPTAGQHEPSRRFLSNATAVEASVWIVARLAEGLDHAHARGLLHRDLKPSNILLAADGTPMLLDFNLAVERLPELADRGVDHAMVGGTLPYMAPEHLDAFHPQGKTSAESVDARSDIYSLGLIFFELLAGESPFPAPPAGLTLLETLEYMAACRRQPPSLRACCPHVPWSLDALASKCLAVDPDRRYRFARDLAEDLRRFLDHLPMKHCPEPSVRERFDKWFKRHPGLRGSTAIAIAAVLTIGVLFGTCVLAYDKMRGLEARVRYRIVDHEFTEIQFLLNTGGNTQEHLTEGLQKADEMFRQCGLEQSFSPGADHWAKRLANDEQARLRDQVIEITLLSARARVLLATQSGSAESRMSAIREAVACLDHVEQVAGTVPSALYHDRASYRAALGDDERAQTDQRRALQTPRLSCHDLTLNATSRLSRGDFLAAEQELKEALRIDCTSFWAWFVLGHCHFMQGRFLEAAGDFAACGVRGPQFAWVHFNRGLALARAGRPRESKSAYDRALDLNPAFSEALVNRAMDEIELDLLVDAERDLLSSRSLGRDDLVVLTSLYEVFARQGRRDEAEHFLKSLLAQYPASPTVAVTRGFARIKADPTGARADFSQVLANQPRHAHALYGMALLIRADDQRAALEYLDRALASDPYLTDAVQLRALTRARLGEAACLEDVEKLLHVPSRDHLYNAACAVAIYADKISQPRLTSRALDLLSRAIDAGFPRSEAAEDPDLRSLRRFAAFARLVGGSTRVPTSVSPE